MSFDIKKTFVYMPLIWWNRIIWSVFAIILLIFSIKQVLNLKEESVFYQGNARVVGIQNGNFGRTYTLKTDIGNIQLKSSEYLNLGKNINVSGQIQTYKFNQNNSKNFNNNYLISTGVKGEFKNFKIENKNHCDIICKSFHLKDNISRYISQTMMNNACLNVLKPDNLQVNCSDVASFSKGLLIGDVSAMSKESKDNIKNFGLTHLIAVSGFQVACLAAALDFIFKKMNFQTKYRFLFTSLFLIFFLFLVGPQPPILRSTLSFLFIQSFLLIGRKMNASRALFLASFIMLVLNPFIIISYSFWLSVLATLGVIFSSKIIDIFNIKNPLFQVIIVCFFAYIFTLGIILQLNNTTNLFSIFLNILISPIIPLISILLLLSLIPIVGQYFFTPVLFSLSFLLNKLDDFKNNKFGINLNIGQKFDLYDTFFYYLILFSLLLISFNKIKTLTKAKNQSLLTDKPRWWNW